MKLSEIPEEETNLKIIAFCFQPRTMVEIAIRINLSLDYVRRNRVPILVGKGYLNKIKTESGRVLYKTSSEIEL